VTLANDKLYICAIHGRNFVVKYEGAAWCENNALQNLKRKMWGTWHIISGVGGGGAGGASAPPRVLMC